MIQNKSDLAAIQLHETEKKILYLSERGKIIVTLHLLNAQTKKMLSLRRFKQVRSCMDLVNRIYEFGNEPVKNAVENIYISSLLALQLFCTRSEWNSVKAMMPRSLHTAYVDHLAKLGHYC